MSAPQGPLHLGTPARLRRAAAGLLGWWVMLGATGLGSATPSAEEELERLRRQAEALESRLRALQAKQADLTAERERLETELALAEVRLRESEQTRAVSAAAVAAAREALAAANHNLAEAAERLKVQLGLLAVLGRAGLTPLVLQAVGSGTDLERRITLIVALVGEQKRRRDEVARLSETRAAALAGLSLRQAELEEAAATEEKRRVELVATRTRVLAELARLEGERRRGAVALADLREAEARLERLWGHIAQERPSRAGEVRLLRGGLPWPVEGGRVVGRYGKRRDAQYGTVTVSNGLSLDVAPGSEVRCVADGTVAYAQYLKGYGNLVIVHHGSDIYSLYARLATMLVQEGRRVRMADGVGMAGPQLDGEGNLYFEIRQGRRSENPLVWLKPR